MEMTDTGRIIVKTSELESSRKSGPIHTSMMIIRQSAAVKPRGKTQEQITTQGKNFTQAENSRKF